MQNVLADAPAQSRNIGFLGKLKFYFAQSTEPEFQLAVEVECAGSFQGEGLNFAVWQGSKIFFLSCQTLNVNSNDALVGKYQPITDALVAGNDSFTFDK